MKDQFITSYSTDLYSNKKQCLNTQMFNLSRENIKIIKLLFFYARAVFKPKKKKDKNCCSARSQHEKTYCFNHPKFSLFRAT